MRRMEMRMRRNMAKKTGGMLRRRLRKWRLTPTTSIRSTNSCPAVKKIPYSIPAIQMTKIKDKAPT
ncbi:hypothetical protein EMPG_16294 [Blastomyces silverae]|uniref:Uncharacterized protein n=1 Tax=Blastomyces silverae TaxID=2060906 RepID=A0A0H1BA45_9EURO|nr:hypothetical protein EMPG_16294 [Blastomyces silverae]